MTIKVGVIGPFVRQPDGRYTVDIFRNNQLLHFELQPDFDPNHPKPIVVNMRCFQIGSCPPINSDERGGYDSSVWSYRGQAISAVSRGFDSSENIPLAIESAVMRNDKALARMRREVDSLKRVGITVKSRRERIPDAVRIFVWQRDLGKCVKCGVSEKLEFDHIIPYSKGGSDTERNIQLLCENCNRSKGATL